MTPTRILNDDAMERLDGAFAFFNRVLSDREFRDQMPDHANVGIMLSSGTALLSAADDPAISKVLYWPDRDTAMIVDPDHAREVVSTR